MRPRYGRHDADAIARMQPSASVKTSVYSPRLGACRPPRCAWNDRRPHRTDRTTRVASDPVPDSLPMTVLTGFLGSGKTTLLRRALGAPAFTDTAVIINEIGEIAIDHYLVDFVEGHVLELPGGCLCCAVREDLAKTLRDLLDKRERGEVRPFRRIVDRDQRPRRPGADPVHARHRPDARPAAASRPGRDPGRRGHRRGKPCSAFPKRRARPRSPTRWSISKTDLAPFSAELAAASRCAEPERRAHRRHRRERPGERAVRCRVPPPQPSPASGGGVTGREAVGGQARYAAAAGRSIRTASTPSR